LLCRISSPMKISANRRSLHCPGFPVELGGVS
jgi:hypothetical protein